MPIKIDFLSNVRDLLKGTKSAADAFDDVADSLDGVVKDGDKAERELERNFKDIANSAKKAGADTGDGMKKGLKDGLKDAKSEAGQSGREAAASFSGGFEDVADFLQETLANAFTGLGPLGAAVGVALAAAVGAALQGAADAQEKLAEARTAAADLSKTLYENKGKLPVEDAINRVLELLPAERGAGNPFESFVNNWVDLGTNIDSVRTAARKADTPVSTFVRGLSGTDLDATADSLEAIEGALTKLNDEANTGTRSNWEILGEVSQLEDLKKQLEGVQTSSQLARESLGAVGSSFDSAEYRAQVEAIGDAWEDAMVDAGDYVDTADGITTFDWSTYLADAESTLAAANEYKRKIFALPPDIKGEAERIFSEQGAKAATSYISAFESSSSTDKQRFVNAAKQNGEAAGKKQGETFAAEAERAAQAKAQGWGDLVMPIKPDDAQLRRYKPPTIYIPGVIVKPGTKQPL